MQKGRELCFIYNAQSSVGHALLDYVHKIVSPDTYACSLCWITYGHLGMHREWAKYLKGLPFKTRFLYQDTLPESFNDVALPAAFMVIDERWEPVIDALQMNAAKTLDGLIALCDRTLATYIAA